MNQMNQDNKSGSPFNMMQPQAQAAGLIEAPASLEGVMAALGWGDG